MDKYTQVGELDERGYADVRRADGKVAAVKFSWLRPTGEEGVFMPKSRVKAVRISMLDWK